MSVICFGEALIDLLSDDKAPESFTKYAGGAPANVAVAVAKQGIKASFCGMFSNDSFAEFLLSELRNYGVETQYSRRTDKAKTALAFVPLDESGERSFSFYRSPSADLLFRAQDFTPEVFINHRILHVCSNSLSEANIYKATIYALSQAKSHSMVCSFDINLRLNLWPSQRYIIDRLWHVIALSDIVKLSQQELDFLHQHSHTEHGQNKTIDAILATNTKCIIVTDGAKPIKCYTNSCQFQVLPPKVEAIDTTAAGDAFVGGFLSQLSKHESPSMALTCESFLTSAINYASRCGAYAATIKGAFSSIPSGEQILDERTP
ncbi:MULTISPECIES: carbohydrate kinase family protein [Pseudoalteromonas]|uniref:Fructokinase n=1 Tax=Pseudoalteromonas amylolytica TaxID=1859457 RepID=A0A1S1MVU7_9GAMM|nr:MULTISPECIES: carbohydrate kinase [Pseudoalteromonas]OHU85467.1 fructokinase [Pseudoalteromonas sp. JW3]OHU92912.1 fructokinase [Pseudoalteromonas amylolytica]